MIAKVVGTLPAQGLNTSLNHSQAQQRDAISWLRFIPGASAMTLEDSLAPLRESADGADISWLTHIYLSAFRNNH